MSGSQIEKDPIRDDILNGARELFIRFGFKKTTMEDIAKQIGKSKSALYYYYKTKEEIFEAVALQDMDASHRAAAEAVAREEAAADKFRAFVVTLFEGVKEKSNLYSVFRAEVFENPFLIVNISEKRVAYMEEFFKNILIYGISRGEVRVMSNTEMDVWARTINWSLKAIGARLFMEDKYDEMVPHIDFIAEILFKGVTPGK